MSPTKGRPTRAPAPRHALPTECDLPAYLGLGWLARDTVHTDDGELRADYTWRDELVYRIAWV
jgi:hypothetical protein